MAGCSRIRFALGVGLEPGFDTADQAFGVFRIDLAQDVVGQAKPVDSPESLGRERVFSIWKVFVLSLKKSPVVMEPFGHPWAVGGKQDAVRVPEKKRTGRDWLAAQLRNSRGDIDMQIGIGV